MKINQNMKGYCGLYLQDISKLPGVMKASISYQNKKMDEFMEHLVMQVIPQRQNLIREKEEIMRSVKKIRAAIDAENQRYMKIKSAINKL